MNAYQWSCKEESALSYDDELEKKLYSEDSTDRFSMKDQQSKNIYDFEFDCIYKDKQLRLNLLEITLKKLKLFGHSEDLTSTCFLSSGFKLNEHESKGILESLRGSNFFLLVKFMIVQKYIEAGHDAVESFRLVNQLKEPAQIDEKVGTKRGRFHFCDHTFSIEHVHAPVYNALLNTIWSLQGFLERSEKTLYNSPWNRGFNHARYRLAKHICSFSAEPMNMLEIFLMNHSKVLLSSKKRPFDRYAVQEEKFQKKVKITTMPQKRGYEGNEDESSASEDTISGSDNENENTLRIVVDNENSVPVENNSPAVPETTLQDEVEIEAEPKTYEFKGPERWEEVKEIFKTRQESVVELTKQQTQAWLLVCTTGIILLLLTLLIDYRIVPMVEYDVYRSDNILALFAVLLVGVVLTCRKSSMWINILMFLVFCFLCLWTGNGSHKEFKFPAVSYVCCSLATLLYRKERKWIVSLPATGFLALIAVGYYYSTFDIFSRCCAIVFTASSFLVEYRKGECHWHKILVSPIRDICFVLFCPLYMFIQISG